MENKELAYALNDNSVAEIVFIMDSVESVYHRWDKGKVTKEPTAFEEGEMTYTCRDCKDTKKETILVLLTSEEQEIVRKAEELGFLTYLELSDLDKVTRLEMVKLIGGYMDWDISLDIELTDTDCQDLTKLEQKLIAMTCKSGFMDCYDDGSFKPNHPVTRAEMAVILAKLLHGTGVDSSQFAGDGIFTDVPAWASGYVNLCAALGLFEPMQGDKFYPNDILDKISALQWMLNALGSNQQEEYVWIEHSIDPNKVNNGLWMYASLTRNLNGLWRQYDDPIRYTVSNAPSAFSSTSDREVTEWIDTDQDGELDKSNIQGRIFKAYCRVPTFGVQSLSYVEQTYEPGRKFNIYNGQSEVVDATGDDTSFRVDKDTMFVDVQNERSFTGYETVPNLTNVELAYVLKDNSVADVVFILDAPNPVAYIAQFGMRIKSDPTLQDVYVYTCHSYFADGTDAIYEVDVDNSNGIDFSAEPTQDEVDKLNGLGTDLYKADGGMKGLYEVHVLDNGKLEIDRLTIDAADTAPDVFDEGVRLVRGHSTLPDTDDNYIQTNDGIRLYSTHKTKFFYVTGSYEEDSLDVRVITSIANIVPVTNVAPGADDPTITGKDTATADDPGDNIGTGIRQVFYTIRVGANITRAINSAMLIQGVTYTAEDTDVYYYNNHDYSVTETENGFVVNYSIWNSQTGEAYEITDDNGGEYYATAAEAKLTADTLESGFYSVSYKMTPKFTPSMDISDGAQDGYTKTDDVYYVLEDTVSYNEYTDKLCSGTNFGITLSNNAVVVDFSGQGLVSLAKIKDAIVRGGNIKLAYMANKNLEVEAIFVTGGVYPITIAYIAQFGSIIKTDPDSVTTQEVYTAHAYFDDGTDAVYEVDVDNSDGIDFSAQPTQDVVDQLNGIGTELYKADGGMKGLYAVRVRNDKLEIDSLTIDAADTAPDIFDEGVRLFRDRTTLMDGNDNHIQNNDGIYLYSNNHTKFFYVTGSYEEDSLDVCVITGIKNIAPVTNVAFGTDDPTITGKDTAVADDPSDNIGIGIRQAFYTIRTTSEDTTCAINSSMLIQGVTIPAQMLLRETYAKPSDDLLFEQFDMTFSASPISHESMDSSTLWDFIVWSNAKISFELYQSEDNGKNWDQVMYTDSSGEQCKDAAINTNRGSVQGVSIGNVLQGNEFQALVNATPKVYGIKLTSINDEFDEKYWDGSVTIRITAVSGNKASLKDAANSLLNRGDYVTVVDTNPAISDITNPLEFSQGRIFINDADTDDNTAPEFNNNRPSFTAGESMVNIRVGTAENFV